MHFINICVENQQIHQLLIQFIVCGRHNTPIHNILSTASELSISHKALETLPEDGNVMQKHAESTIHDKLNE